MSEAWFKPKRFGYGATPASWQGWLLTAILTAILFLIGGLAAKRGEIYLLLMIPVLLGFALIIAQKTEGGLRWRWRWRRD
jgi:4-hydroxybenzoate polyprenyltransferase